MLHKAAHLQCGRCLLSEPVKVLIQVCVCHVGNLISTNREPSLSYREISEPGRFRQPDLPHLFISMCLHSTLGKAEVPTVAHIMKKKTTARNIKSAHCGKWTKFVIQRLFEGQFTRSTGLIWFLFHGGSSQIIASGGIIDLHRVW